MVWGLVFFFWRAGGGCKANKKISVTFYFDCSRVRTTTGFYGELSRFLQGLGIGLRALARAIWAACLFWKQPVTEFY